MNEAGKGMYKTTTSSIPLRWRDDVEICMPHREGNAMTDKPTPEPGSRWRHRNGTPYTVLHIANQSGNDLCPQMVVYQGPNGKVWARRVDDWHRSMEEDLT